MVSFLRGTAKMMGLSVSFLSDGGLSVPFLEPPTPKMVGLGACLCFLEGWVDFSSACHWDPRKRLRLSGETFGLTKSEPWNCSSAENARCSRFERLE